jgi:hypothetical protein
MKMEELYVFRHFRAVFHLLQHLLYPGTGPFGVRSTFDSNDEISDGFAQFGYMHPQYALETISLHDVESGNRRSNVGKSDTSRKHVE